MLLREAATSLGDCCLAPGRLLREVAISLLPDCALVAISQLLIAISVRGVAIALLLQAAVVGGGHVLRRRRGGCVTAGRGRPRH